MTSVFTVQITLWFAVWKTNSMGSNSTISSSTSSENVAYLHQPGKQQPRVRPGAKKGNASRFTSFTLPLPCTVGGSRRSHFKCWFWWTLWLCMTFVRIWPDLICGWMALARALTNLLCFFLHLNVTENHRKTPMFQQSSFAGVYSWSKRVFTRLPWRPSDDRDVNQWWSEFLGWAQGVIFGDTILRSFKIHEMCFFWGKVSKMVSRISESCV